MSRYLSGTVLQLPINEQDSPVEEPDRIPSVLGDREGERCHSGVSDSQFGRPNSGPGQEIELDNHSSNGGGHETAAALVEGGWDVIEVHHPCHSPIRVGAPNQSPRLGSPGITARVD